MNCWSRLPIKHRDPPKSGLLCAVYVALVVTYTYFYLDHVSRGTGLSNYPAEHVLRPSPPSAENIANALSLQLSGRARIATPCRESGTKNSTKSLQLSGRARIATVSRQDRRGRGLPDTFASGPILQLVVSR